MARDQGPHQEDRRQPGWRADAATGALIVLLAARHLGYYHVPQAMQGYLFAALGSVCILVLLVLRGTWWPLMLWAGGEELMSATCSVWSMFDPLAWADEQCSARVGIRLGAFGLVGLSMVIYGYASVRSYRSQRRPRR